MEKVKDTGFFAMCCVIVPEEVSVVSERLRGGNSEVAEESFETECSQSSVIA
jgi:hypothetical protein